MDVVSLVVLWMVTVSDCSLLISLFWFCSTTEPSSEGETAIFLRGQEKIWKGLIYMQSVAKFVTKAYLVSGSFDHLKEVCVLPNH